MDKLAVPSLKALVELLLSNQTYSRCILLVRHGESQGNTSWDMHGSTEYELTARGVSQAKEIGDALDPFVDHIKKVKTSTMIRSIQTCHHVMNIDIRHEWKGEIIYDYRLREINLGAMEGTYVDLANIAQADYSAVWHCVMANHIKPPGSEGGLGFNRRVKESLREAVDGLNVYFAHSGVIYTMAMDTTGRHFVGNCGAIGLGYDNKKDLFELIGVYNGHNGSKDS